MEFPTKNIPAQFPVAKQGKPDTLSAEPLQEVTIKKKNKSQVSFESPGMGADKCRDCKHFDPSWSCYLVNGVVKPDDWCNEYDEVKGIGLPIASNTTSNLPQTGVKKY
jgi:hypothetical protein